MLGTLFLTKKELPNGFQGAEQKTNTKAPGVILPEASFPLFSRVRRGDKLEPYL
jgi:hypothetical protein